MSLMLKWPLTNLIIIQGADSEALYPGPFLDNLSFAQSNTCMPDDISEIGRAHV